MTKNYRKEAIKMIAEAEENRIDKLEAKLRIQDKKKRLKEAYNACVHEIKYTGGHRADEYCVKCGMSDSPVESMMLKNLDEKYIDRALEIALGEA